MSTLDIPHDSFITIRWDADEDRWELDLGDVNHYEAKGVLLSCLNEMNDRDPQVRVRFGGADLDTDADDEDEPKEDDEG